MNIAEMNELYEMIKCPIRQEIPADPMRMDLLRGGEGQGPNADADMRNQVWSMQALQLHCDATGLNNFTHPLTREPLPFVFRQAHEATTMISLAIRYNIQIRRATGQPIDRNMQDIETDVNNYLNARTVEERTRGEKDLAEFIRNPAAQSGIAGFTAETCASIRRKYNPQTLQTGIIRLPRCVEREILKLRAEENRVTESNRYADQMALAGHNRTTAFYTYYNRQTEPQRVAAANRWADVLFANISERRPWLLNLGMTRTRIFYNYYSGTNAYRRNADSQIEVWEEVVADANYYADQVATLGRDRNTAFYAYYNADPQVQRNLTNTLATDMAAAAAAAAIAAVAETARVTAANLYADQAATIPGKDRTTAFYAHYKTKSDEERQALANNLQVARVNATAAVQAERERVEAANRYADQMALTGQDRTTAFYAYYNKQTEQQRVATANQYADQVVATIPGKDRTTAFYAHYNASSPQERKMLEDALSVSIASARMESDCVAAANQQADAEARNGVDRTTSFFTHYASIKEREKVKSANLYADYALSMGQDRTVSFYTHYNAKSAEERQALDDQVSIPRKSVVNAF